MYIYYVYCIYIDVQFEDRRSNNMFLIYGESSSFFRYVTFLYGVVSKTYLNLHCNYGHTHTQKKNSRLDKAGI